MDYGHNKNMIKFSGHYNLVPRSKRCTGDEFGSLNLISDFYRQPVQRIFEIIPFLQILLTSNMQIIDDFLLWGGWY